MITQLYLILVKNYLREIRKTLCIRNKLCVFNLWRIYYTYLIFYFYSVQFCGTQTMSRIRFLYVPRSRQGTWFWCKSSNYDFFKHKNTIVFFLHLQFLYKYIMCRTTTIRLDQILYCSIDNGIIFYSN